MGCPHVGCSKQAPSRIEPEVGQVPENLSESEGQVAPHVLEYHEPWTKHAHGISNSRPEMSLIVGSLSSAGGGERLAQLRVAGA